MATLLDSLLNTSTRAKSSMQKSALVRTRRAIRSAPERLVLLITTLSSQARSSQTPLTLVPLIGVAVGVMIRLKNVKDISLTHLPVSAKVLPPAYVLTRLIQILHTGRHFGFIYGFDFDVESPCTIAHFGMSFPF
jgi:hypothetical protein